MIGKLVKIPLSDIKKVGIYINSKKLTMAQIKKEIGCHFILNGGLYNMTTFMPVNCLTVDGRVLSTGGNPFGYGFSGEKITFSYGNDVLAPNFIGSYPCLVRNGKRESFSVPSGLGGDRGRSAIGLTSDSFVMRCVPDLSDTSDYTLDELAGDMLSIGCIDAINLDGGGSSQCDFNGEQIKSSRIVHNYICVWVKEETKLPKVVLDPGHGVETAGKCSPDKSYYEHEFALDMAKRIKPILERHGVAVTLTRTDEHLLAASEATDLKKRVEIANGIPGLDLFVSLHSNASGSEWSSAKGLCIYTSAKGDTKGRNIAANAIIARMKEAGITLRSSALNHELFYVLKNTVAAAVLIEHGFHTNKEELELLKSSAYRDKLAVTDSKGILDYLGIAWVESTHWAEKHLDSLTAKGIITEPEKHRRDLDGVFTKGEILAMLDRIS